MMQHIVSYSGGKDSTAMLLMMIERHMPIDRIVFADTTLEYPEMYGWIDRVEQIIG
ncbi:phosphoadenosine phosphosulfate reductase family protein, partial [candidate division KSB3 bacterium]|nr:phosphoadenosine phosphosulfate reductase family protein [candidate division KSB3 bacterium]